MNFKRLISAALSIILLISCIQINVIASTDNIVITDEMASVLTALEIVDTPVEERNFINPVSRADFALYTGKLIGIDERSKCSERFFTDLPVDHWAVNTINTLTKLGIISGQDGKFYPENIISEAEALSMLLNAIGFKPIAQAKGGYPAGYRTLARECKITTGRAEATELTFADACELLYNTLLSPVPELDGISVDGNIDIYINKNTTVLETNFDIERITGVLTSTLGISADAYPACDDNKIRIDGITYYNSCYEAVDYLGMQVNAYCLKKDNTPTVMWVFPEDDGDCITIDIDDFIEYDDASHKILYAKNEKTQSKSIDKSATIVRNGQGYSAKVKEAFKGLKKGSITLGKSAGGSYDIVIIKNYEDAVVQAIDVNEHRIYDKSNSGALIDLDDMDYIRVFDGERNKKTFSDIIANTVVSLCRSDKYCEILINNKTVSGNVGEVETKDSKTNIMIDNEYYPVDNDYYNANAHVFEIGKKITAYIDVFGQCVYAESGAADIYLTGYMLGIKYGSFGGCSIKLLNQSGNMEIFECSKRLIIDGVGREKKDEIDWALSKRNNGNVKNQLIRYSLDSNNEIKKIETAVPYGESYNSDSLRAETQRGSFLYYSGNTMLGPSIKLASNTLCFVVPSATSSSTSDDDYSVISPSNLVSNSTYTATAYKTTDATNTADIVLIELDENTKGEWYHHLVLVDSVYYKYDEKEGVGIEVADVWVNGTKSTYYAAKGRTFSNMPKRDGTAKYKIQAGDVLRVYKNQQGEITEVDRAWSYSDKTPSSLNTAWDWELFINYGYITSIKNGVVKFEYNENDTNISGITGTAPIVVFDPNARYDSVRLGGDIDLYSAMNEQSLIYVGQRYGATGMIIILKQ